MHCIHYTQTQADNYFLKRACALARRGTNSTSPNPPVGALIVNNGSIVGMGWHQRAGEAHAEVLALQQAAGRTAGGTLYVSLEPCNHHGKTPACVDCIIAAGIKRVVVGCRDCNANVRGRGIETLEAAGITVTQGVAEVQAKSVIQAWEHWQSTGKPYVVLKLASSLDGVIRPLDNRSQWISGTVARAEVQRLRSRVDAIMVGRRTVEADNPRLTNRSLRGAQPLRIVLDSGLSLALDKKIFKLEAIEKAPVMLVASHTVSTEKVKQFEAQGVEVVRISADNGRLELRELFELLGKRGIRSLLSEGGAAVASYLLDSKLCNELLLYVKPVIFGQDSKLPRINLLERHKLVLTSAKRCGQDIKLTFKGL